MLGFRGGGNIHSFESQNCIYCFDLVVMVVVVFSH